MTLLRRNCDWSRSRESKSKTSEHCEVGVKRNLLKTANAKRRESVAVLQVSEQTLHGCASTVEVMEPLCVSRDAREQATTECEREGNLVCLGATERDNRLATAFLTLGIDAGVVVALVHRARFRVEAASVDRVDERRDEVGLLPSRGFDAPRERKARHGANSGVNLVAVEAATLASGHSGAMPPTCIGVAEPFAFFASLADVALTIRERGEVGGVYRYVTSKIRVLSAKRRGARIEASLKRRTVLAQLPGEPVHGPHARALSERVLEAGMLCDQSRYPRPGGEREQTFDEASADERASTEALASGPAERVKFRDQGGYFGRIEEFRNVADGRATRYLASCHASYLSCGHGLRRFQPRGGLFLGFAGQTLTTASDGSNECSPFVKGHRLRRSALLPSVQRSREGHWSAESLRLPRLLFLLSTSGLTMRPVYLLYADESGDLRDPPITHFVVGGIAVHEDAVRPLAGRINGRINAFVGSRLGKQLEIHGGPMRFGGGLWERIPENKRNGLARSLMRVIRDWEHEASRSAVQPFVIALDRDFTAAPTETAYGELLYLLDIFLRTGRRRGEPHNGILVADRSRYQRTIEAWVQLARARARLPRQDPRRLYALAEAPFFIDSRSTRLMQLADLLAYAVFRGLSANDWNWANEIVPALMDAEPRRYLHLTRDEACGCAACAA